MQYCLGIGDFRDVELVLENAVLGIKLGGSHIPDIYSDPLSSFPAPKKVCLEELEMQKWTGVCGRALLHPCCTYPIICPFRHG